ncbi:MAG TPA: DUF1622 domain-containing protein [Longimicrobiales bacterium]
MIQEAAGPVPLREPAAYTHVARWATAVIEVAGIAAIVIGAAVATVAFARELAAKAVLDDAYRRYRVGLGRSILLGLEFLIAADIIRTVAIQPSFRSVGVLAIVVLIRTFLSFTLSAEIEGRLPWRRRGQPH